MPITFACATSHAPGIAACAEAAPPEQKQRVYDGFNQLRQRLEASGAQVLICLTSEHWANFSLDHMDAFCVGRAEKYSGPVEAWLKIAPKQIAGSPALAGEILEAAYDGGIEPGFSYAELRFDHGTMVPLNFIMPAIDRPVVPIFFNVRAVPQPSARRCLEFGRLIGRVAAGSPHRVGLIATGGLSHDPQGRNHALIDTRFDEAFLRAIQDGDVERLAGYSRAKLAVAGPGTFEVLTWVALAGAVNGRKGKVIAYEAVKPWATGVALVDFPVAL